jgi:hypothetical protein
VVDSKISFLYGFLASGFSDFEVSGKSWSRFSAELVKLKTVKALDS